MHHRSESTQASPSDILASQGSAPQVFCFIFCCSCSCCVVRQNIGVDESTIQSNYSHHASLATLTNYGKPGRDPQVAKTQILSVSSSGTGNNGKKRAHTLHDTDPEKYPRLDNLQNIPVVTNSTHQVFNNCVVHLGSGVMHLGQHDIQPQVLKKPPPFIWRKFV